MAFSFQILLTGDCSNNGTGAISVVANSGYPPYTYEWVYPDLSYEVSYYGSVRTNLNSNTYQVRITDSNGNQPLVQLLNIFLSNGVCCSIVDTQTTTCNLNNGRVTGRTDTQNVYGTVKLIDENNNTIQSAVTYNTDSIFFGLSAGTYSLRYNDSGGCTGQTQSFIIENSSNLDFDFYVVQNSTCSNVPIGKIYVTGQTGIPPYTYNWSNGEKTEYITGLTSGGYSVNVTDSTGCSTIKSTTVNTVDPIGTSFVGATSPTCLDNNGTITITITGGTAPFYCSASTGNIQITYSRNYFLTGLTNGVYSVSITDAAFCNITRGVTLNSFSGMTSVNVITKNSSCSALDGSISASVVGGTPPFTYTLIYPDSSSFSLNSTYQSYLFSNLSGGTYTLSVKDSYGCTFISEYSIITENKFTIDATSTGATNTNNGVIDVTKIGEGTQPFTYVLDDKTSILNTILTAVTFYNVSPGQHTVTVSDAVGCIQTTQIFVSSISPVNFYLSPKSAGLGSEGEITAFISSGTPPFIFNWSDNIPENPQEITVTGLTAGTYSLTVTDINNSIQKRTVEIPKINKISSYETFTMGEQQVQINTEGKYSLSKMLNEGYIDIISGHTGCQLNSASFTAKVNVQPYNFQSSNTFFTTTSLLVSPEDNLWYDTAKELLLSVQGVSNVIIDELNNKFTIEGDLSVPNVVGGNNPISISLSLSIDYNISCIS